SQAQPRVVIERGHERLPLRGQARRLANRGHCRVRHGDRTSMAALDLGPDVESRRASRVGAGPWLAPGERVEAVTDSDLHQLVPGRMELDLVDPLTEAIVRAQA